MRVVVACLVALAACQGTPPNLSSTDQDVVTMAVTSHDFAMVQVGQTSSAFTFTISPAAGNQSDTVDSITENCPDFSVNAVGLPAVVYRTCDTCCFTLTGQPVICPVRPEGAPIAPVACCTTDFQDYSFDTYFSPTVSGTVSCTVTISLDGGGTTKLVTLTGTGTPPPIHIAVQPSSVAFGDVRRNTDSTAVAVNVSNTGGQAMTVSSTSLSAGFAIASGPTGGFTVGAGGNQPISLICHPTATGPLNGSFVINSNDPSNPQVTVPLSCNGIDSNLVIAPSPVMLPTTRVGEAVQATVALQNTGAASMTIEGISVTGQDLQEMNGPSTPMTLGANGSTNLTVSFAAASKETSSGTLVVTYDGGQTRSAQLSARALSTSMAVSPDGDVDFGPVCAGQTKMQSFSIIANDEGPFKVTAISAPDVPFMATLPTLPANVQGAGGSMLTFDVTAAPTTEGTQTSTMMVTTDIPGGAQHSINLSVDALAAGVSATPAMIDFGSTAPLTTTIGQDVSLSNCSTAAITASNPRIEGASAAEFAIVQQPDSAMIQPTASASWLVVMQPHDKGPKQANFVVDYDGGTAMVPLTGEGLGSDVGSAGGVGEKSYYSCTVGGGGAGWPIGVALVLIVRRRKRR